jgi:hypothetical protein
MATANSGFNEDKKRASPGKDFLHRGRNRSYTEGSVTGLQLNQRKDQTSRRKTL